MDQTVLEKARYHGSLVAFEGSSDVISTQLRLLPRSPNILILPPLKCFLRRTTTDHPFEARSYVRDVHDACLARAETALSFLRLSTPTNKRLVFMNGGTVSAHMNCITSIGQHDTDGNLKEAEIVFNELVKNGIRGLEGGIKRTKDRGPDADIHDTRLDDREGGLLDDPASKAMRAAEALDLETASLQSDHDIDLTTTGGTRSRSASVPIRLVLEDLEDATPFYVFVSGDGAGHASPRVRDDGFRRSDESTHTPHELDHHELRAAIRREISKEGAQSTTTTFSPKPLSCVGDAYPNAPVSSPNTDVLSPRSIVFESMPGTPTVIGQARVVDVRRSCASATTTHKRIRSVDRIYANGVRNQDILLCNFSQKGGYEGPQDTDNAQPGLQDVGVQPQRNSRLLSKFFTGSPRLTLVDPTTTKIRRRAPSPLDLSTTTSKKSSIYVNRSTSPQNHYVNRSTSTEPTLLSSEGAVEEIGSFLDLEGDPLDTVLPMVEDLVIHFKDKQPDPHLQDLIQAFKEGTYPKSPSKVVSEDQACSNQPSTPSSLPSTLASDGNGSTRDTTESRNSSPVLQWNTDDYDPFASHGDYIKLPTTWLSKSKVKVRSPVIIVPAPPNPVHTPPSSAATTRESDGAAREKRFHEFSTADCRTAVCVQNSLRSVLNLYFSPDVVGYRRLNFPLLPELSSLWKPIFRETEPSAPEKSKRKIDLILALGAQKGVDRDFLGSICGSLESLGAKPSGICRSGRLDLRYLVANAMQAFTAQPLANQTQDNPFSNPLLLATLVIPHLETYLAAHAMTRFLLLEYPPEHLATVLALQRLVGADVLKVAGILLDPQAGGHKGPQPPHTPNSTGTSISDASTSSSAARTNATLLPTPGAKPTKNHHPSTTTEAASAAPFSKANLLITSAATPSEIATLISTIWKILIDLSPFYVPDSNGGPRSSSSSSSSSSGSSAQQQNKQQNETAAAAGLAAAATMMGFDLPAQQQQQRRPPRGPSNYVSSGTLTDPMPPAVPAAAAAPRTLESSYLSLFPTPSSPSPSRQASRRHGIMGASPSASVSVTGTGTGASVKSAGGRTTTNATASATKLMQVLGNSNNNNTSKRASYHNNNNKNNNNTNKRGSYFASSEGGGEDDNNNNNHIEGGGGRSRSGGGGERGRGSMLGWFLDTEYYYDDEDDEEDEEDKGFAAEVRKYMPLYGRRPTDGPRKGNSRKALKWLGLAN
ncbi:hypothetical protein F4778DRAFT_198244 [Xylariomycetidae sp. FL2044]|nr:hypothetical protein F4778DRAFT_198244 [Xylariomycetidae sp. FL2044]